MLLSNIEASVQRTRTSNQFVLDSGNLIGFVSGEIVNWLISDCWDALKCAPQRLAMTDYSEATGVYMTEDYHVRAEHILEKISAMLSPKVKFTSFLQQRKHLLDVPGNWFSAPF